MGARVRGVAVVVVVLVTGAALGTWIAQWLQPAVGGGASGSVTIPTVFLGRMRVEVLNGGGKAGMARAATGILRDAGFDVVEVGNWESDDVPSSYVLDRVGELDRARAVADALGIGEVRREAGSNLYADLTVVLGMDWVPEAAPEPEARGTDGSRWWDIRRYFRRPGAPVDPGARLADPENREPGR